MTCEVNEQEEAEPEEEEYLYAESGEVVGFNEEVGKREDFEEEENAEETEPLASASSSAATTPGVTIINFLMKILQCHNRQFPQKT